MSRLGVGLVSCLRLGLVMTSPKVGCFFKSMVGRVGVGMGLGTCWLVLAAVCCVWLVLLSTSWLDGDVCWLRLLLGCCGWSHSWLLLLLSVSLVRLGLLEIVEIKLS